MSRDPRERKKIVVDKLRSATPVRLSFVFPFFFYFLNKLLYYNFMCVLITIFVYPYYVTYKIDIKFNYLQGISIVNYLSPLKEQFICFPSVTKRNNSIRFQCNIFSRILLNDYRTVKYFCAYSSINSSFLKLLHN